MTAASGRHREPSPVASHPLVLACRQIASRPRRATVTILLDGEHLVDEALAARVRVRDVLVRDGRRRSWSRARRAAGARVHAVSSDVIDAASPVRTPSGVVAIADGGRSR